MCRFTNYRCIVTVRNDQPSFARKISLFLEDSGQVRRNRPIELIAIFKIIGPLAVIDQVGLGNLDFDNGEAALCVDRHQVGTAAIGQRNFTNGEQILPAQKPSQPAGYVGSDWWSVGKTRGFGLRGHA